MPKPSLVESMTPEEREDYEGRADRHKYIAGGSAIAGGLGGLGLGLLARKKIAPTNQLKAEIRSMLPLFGAGGGAFGGGMAGHKADSDNLHELRSTVNRVGRRRNEAWRNRDASPSKEAAYTLGRVHAAKKLGL